MAIGALIGGFLGILGALAGIAAAVYATGCFEYLGGKKKSDIPPLAKRRLLEKLLSLNSSSLPYEIKPARDTDILIEWKIVDAEWAGVFSREGLKRVYRAYILLDENLHAVRYCEEMGAVEWSAGIPKVTFRKEFFRGRILYQKSWGVQYGIKEDLTIGKVYEYKFDIGYLRDPIKEVVEESGWEFVPVLRKSHATYRS